MGLEGSGVLGVGIDLVEVDRFAASLDRAPGLLDRLFTSAERSYANQVADPTQRLAVRFAAKEATLKALGVGLGACAFSQIEVVTLASGQPRLELHDTASTLADDGGVGSWQVSLTHTASMAQAIVMALR